MIRVVIWEKDYFFQSFIEDEDEFYFFDFFGKVDVKFYKVIILRKNFRYR